MTVRELDKNADLSKSLSAADVLSHLSQPAALLDAEGCVNAGHLGFATSSTGPKELSKGTSLALFIDAADQKQLALFLKNAQKKQPVADSLIVHVPTPHAHPQPLKLTPMSKDGALVGFFCQLIGGQDVIDPRLRYMLEHLDQGVWDYDTRTKFFVVSDAWRRMRGLAPEDPINVPNDEWLDQVHPEDREKLQQLFEGQTKGETKNIVVQYRRKHAKGHWIWILCRASVMDVDENGIPTKIVGTDTEISDVKENEGELARIAGKLQLAIEASGMGIWEFDPCTSRVHWDDRMLEIYGITDGNNIRPEDVWGTYLHPDDLEATLEYSDECRRNNTDFKRDYRIVRPDGQIRYVRSVARSVAAPNEQSKLIGVNIDVTRDHLRTQQLENARNKLEHDARHDALSGLGNRRWLDEVSSNLFNRMSASDTYAVMHLDLDHFKQVNDTMGHAAGDFVLAEVSTSLARIIGDMGQPFRVGGDEFAVLFEKAPDTATMDRLCKELIASFCTPLNFEGELCQIGVSIGYAFGEGPPRNPSEVFINADTALYAAKNAGRSCFRSYSGVSDADTAKIKSPRKDLREAMENDELVVFYQPQYDAKTLQIVGAEALVRWHCPARGVLTPDHFLPQADAVGLTSEIDDLVFKLVTDQQSEWAARGLSYPVVSVNTSMATLDDKGLVNRVASVLEPHHKISLELLETSFLDSLSDKLAFRLDTLRELGLRIELDDFGSGHSSIAALQAVRPDVVKIDKSLIDPIATNPLQIRTLQSLSEIARISGAQIFIEGLESGIHLAAIRHVDCDVLQGYALQRPMPVNEFSALLKKTTAASAG